MSAYLNLKLQAIQLWKLNYEELHDDVWADIDRAVTIYKVDDGIYQQYVLDENDNHIDVGISLKTVGDLMKPYNSITGHELMYWDKDYPQTGQ